MLRSKQDSSCLLFFIVHASRLRQIQLSNEPWQRKALEYQGRHNEAKGEIDDHASLRECPSIRQSIWKGHSRCQRQYAPHSAPSDDEYGSRIWLHGLHFMYPATYRIGNVGFAVNDCGGQCGNVGHPHHPDQQQPDAHNAKPFSGSPFAPVALGFLLLPLAGIKTVRRKLRQLPRLTLALAVTVLSMRALVGFAFPGTELAVRASHVSGAN
jgi:hypothetical protein